MRDRHFVSAVKEGANAATDGGCVTSTLWVLRKEGRSMTCVISGESGKEALQVLLDCEVYLDEMHAVHGGAVGRAHTLQRAFEAHGWSPVVALVRPRS